jgi:4-amino-4-deoxy-L-arabinose transferase-like glycosyltransferase
LKSEIWNAAGFLAVPPAMKNHTESPDRRRAEEPIGLEASSRFLPTFVWFAAFAVLLLLHYPLLRLPYYWDEAGYYIPAATDFFRSWRLIPQSTLLTGHTPLVIIYLAFAWRAFGFSPLVTRAAMMAPAAWTLACVYGLARRVANREVAFWSVLLLALSPLFFAQSTLAHLDLAAGLFTLLALAALLDDRPARFAFACTAAVLSKETAVVLLPAAGIFIWWQRRRSTGSSVRGWWTAFLVPLAALLAWAAFYHHVTGGWTGNREYLRYNLYATLNPIRVLLTLLRRLYETFVGGFNWVLTAGAMAGILWTRKSHPAVVCARAGTGPTAIENSVIPAKAVIHSFFFLAGLLSAVYLLMLSAVGGAVLPRYLLPIFPPLVLAAVFLIWRLPRRMARSIMVLTAGCFVWAWFLNPPYPFPFEDNLAYADFIHLHQQAARLLEDQACEERILTAWPATDELVHPLLGYVLQPLKVVPMQDFTRHDFDSVSAQSFDCVYLYSRHWEPPNNWLNRHIWLQRLQQSYFEYQPQIPENELATRYHLRLLAGFERRGQWVRVYARINP